MDMPLIKRPCPMSWVWASSIVFVWALVAASLGQPLWAQQHSRDLVAFGAALGNDFTISQAWKLLASQWLHVRFPHMLFNAFVIASVGQVAEARYGWRLALGVGLAGGSIAQLATIYAQPHAFISGASQAYLVMCALVLVAGAMRSFGWWMAILGVLIGFTLDVFVSSHGAIKPGHLTGLALGVISGVALRAMRRV